ncbi:cytoskeleton protein RodZ [Xenorhabdus mauleonii]|uniref:Cytoskeleton protein RodZ n=1 Tax=Xenorhabdus mauleonii TaxID=351675 RepID=A0A1I3JK36_9GAMM|nr:cytoskeleton protein RodZ [Xenorhabdus mauleonii]PHM46234.1 cytoskeleton protein RodZ [Xenorhabdus mauleonii]SFI60611.1 cytoskeleton protein RodZ [Xenorhabdus mauleonii]
MKTETYPEEANLTAGQILCQAREKLELSQQNVADRLCLKLSTVRDIEEDHIPSNITPTFFRGYIRAYAKLVQVPEAEILSVLDKQMPVKTVKVSQMQSFSSGKKRKKRDGWLMKITWAVIILLLGMTVLWWWQNHKEQQNEFTSMAEQSSAQHTENDSAAAAETSSAPAKEGQPVEVSQNKLSSAQINTGTPAMASAESKAATPSTTSAVAENNASVANASTADAGISNAGTANSAASTSSAASISSVVSTSATDVNNIEAATNNELVMNFSGRCWVEVKNAKGKTLFNGIKNKGDSLMFSGEQSYSLIIGAPAWAKVQFQGKPVDLGTFIKKGTTAKLTLK